MRPVNRDKLLLRRRVKYTMKYAHVIIAQTSPTTSPFKSKTWLRYFPTPFIYLFSDNFPDG